MSEEVMFNCSSERLTDGGYEDCKAYCLYARKMYRKGEQVCFKISPKHFAFLPSKVLSCVLYAFLNLTIIQVLLGYGTYTNLELLEHYGFLLDENPNDKTYIQLDLELCTIGSWPKDSLYIHPNGHPSFALLCALRLWKTPANRRKVFSHQIYSGSTLSVENELEVMKWLGNKCVETLQQSPTTVEFDASLIYFLHNLHHNTNWRVDVDQSSFGQEFAAFLRFHGVNLEYAHNQLTVRLLRSLERWELAVRWRCSYKRALTKCIVYCKRSIHELSLQ